MGPKHGPSPLSGREQPHNTGRCCQSADRLMLNSKGASKSRRANAVLCPCRADWTVPRTEVKQGRVVIPPPSTCSNEVVHQGVVVISTQERAGEYDTVEWDVVLGHEVVELNLISRGRRRAGGNISGPWCPALLSPPPCSSTRLLPAVGSSTTSPTGRCSWL